MADGPSFPPAPRRRRTPGTTRRAKNPPRKKNLPSLTSFLPSFPHSLALASAPFRPEVPKGRRRCSPSPRLPVSSPARRALGRTAPARPAYIKNNKNPHEGVTGRRRAGWVCLRSHPPAAGHPRERAGSPPAAAARFKAGRPLLRPLSRRRVRVIGGNSPLPGGGKRAGKRASRPTPGARPAATAAAILPCRPRLPARPLPPPPRSAARRSARGGKAGRREKEEGLGHLRLPPGRKLPS